ncbi:protein translocase subunit SecDF [Tannerella sp. AM09-19]|nr:protein translocase subunit SecDF [Tannerella sp. AM09-19]
MQNKGFIRVFAVLLTLVCLFYISFSFVTRHYTKKAEEYANGDAMKYKQYIDSIATEKVYLGYYTFKQCREMEIGLGLDLKGGMNVTLQISVADVLRSLSNNNTDVNFNKALANATANQADNKDFLSAFVNEYKKLDPNIRLAAIFSTYQLKDKITPNATNDEVVAVLREELNSAIDNSFNVLRTRIDRFGVVAPNIQRLEKDGRILVELPGVKEPERVRKLLQGSANLEFWETYNLNEFFNKLASANELLARLENQSEDTSSKADSTVVELQDSTAVTATTSLKDSLTQKIKDMNKSDEQQNINAWKKQNPLFARLNPNVSQEGAIGNGPAVGIAHINDTAAVNKYLAMRQVRELLPANIIFKWTVKPIDKKEQYFQLVALKATNGGRPPLEGDVITDAREDFDRMTNSAVVSMSMNAEGSKIWEQLTRENIGRCVAIVLDDQVYSFPVVNTEISGGNSQISGNFTPEEAKDLANVLKSGKMAASVKIVQEDIIGPSLGQEAIQSGIISFIFALVLLMVYMISMYGVTPGLVANLGLVLNMFFTMGILASFQAVLTLSGIAGLVLSLGIAVDANVLIYERAKEELRLGKNLKNAITDGYKNAFSAIFDSNLTSLITGLILFFFGTGPIKGFATTLMIGIAMSFFTAVFLTRLIYERGLEKNWFKHLTFTTSLTKNWLTHPKINFLGARKTGYIVCAVLVVIGVISFGIKGLSKGIDFSGGRNYVVRFQEPVNTQEIANLLKPYFEGSSLSVITIGGENQVRVSTNYRIAENDDAIDKEIEMKLYDGLKSMLGGKTLDQFKSDNIMSIQKVGPSIAEDITIGAIWAVILSLIAIALYILLRFRDISFSAGTLVSLAFDTVIIISFYSLFYGLLPFSMEIDQSFIAAILTVIGYSVNDKVVVFDRVREVIGLYPKRDRYLVINEALNSTLARTISTSLSTAIVLLCIFILGGDTIRSFTFAMLLGVIVGTFSTLFVAVPVAYEIMGRKQKKAQLAEAAK